MREKRHFCIGIGRMRAALSLMCIISMLFVGMAPVNAAQNTAKLLASSETAGQGSEVSVKMELSGNPGIWGLKLKIDYNQSALELKSVENGDIFKKEEVTCSGLDNKPFVYLACYDNTEDNITTNGLMATLKFKVKSDAAAGSYPITLDLVQAINKEQESVSITFQNGAVTVTGAGGIENNNGSSNNNGNSSTSSETCSHKKVWKVTTAADCEKDGVETETCTICGVEFGTRTIKATGHLHTQIKDVVQAAESTKGYTGDTYCTDCGKCIAKGTTIPALKNTSRKVGLQAVKSTKTTNVLTWKAVEDADGYIIYSSQVGKSTVKKTTIKTGSQTTWTHKKLKAGTGYEYYIRVYKLVNGKKLYLAKSQVIRSVTTGGKYGNATAVKVNKKSVSLAKAKKFKVKAELVSEKLPVEISNELRYETSNSKVATVNSEGVVKAKKTGTCYVYVYAPNGISTRIKIKVK